MDNQTFLISQKNTKETETDKSLNKNNTIDLEFGFDICHNWCDCCR